MNNLEWYELATGIGRRTGSIVPRRTGSIVGDKITDRFAGVELDASDAAKVHKKDWSLDDLPDDCRSAIDELLERMPEMNPGRDLEIFKAARDIGWIEAMAKQPEWWSLQQSQNSKKRAGPARKKKADKRHRELALEYLRFIGQGKTDLEARNAIIDDRKNKKKKPLYDLSALSRIITEQKVR